MKTIKKRQLEEWRAGEVSGELESHESWTERSVESWRAEEVSESWRAMRGQWRAGEPRELESHERSVEELLVQLLVQCGHDDVIIARQRYTTPTFTAHA